jgi:hypothetical protein
MPKNLFSGAKEREYLRNLFRPLISLILEDSNLDLECDPVAIHKSIIREEEITTGEKSTRQYDVTVDVASQDEKVREIQSANFEKLRNITDQFLNAIVKSAIKMPFGIRYISMKMRDHMSAKFPGAEYEKDVNDIIGNLLYYRYMNPVIVAPEAFDVIEATINPNQRKNLAEIARTLHSISVGKDVGGNEIGGHQEKLNKYIKDSASKFAYFRKECTIILTKAMNTVSAEEYFEMTEFLDIGGRQKLTVYITPDEIVQVHNSLVNYLEDLPKLHDDPLRKILDEMGTPPSQGSAAKGPGSEIVLNLTNRFANLEGC